MSLIMLNDADNSRGSLIRAPLNTWEMPKRPLRLGSKSRKRAQNSDVRLWHIADIDAGAEHVRFGGQSIPTPLSNVR